MKENSYSNSIFSKILSLLKGQYNSFANTRENLKQTVDNFIEEHKNDEKTLENSEIKIIQNVFSYGELTASDVMVPRTDIGAVNIDIDLENLKKYIEEKRHTRFPVYDDSLDNIVGYINIKDLFPIIFADKDFKLKDIVREILIVPPSIKIIKLLSKMRKNKTHIALVVDEYGGADGLVTIEDIIEEIVGELDDEHDVLERPNFSLINENTMIANARLDIEEFEKKFDVKLERDEKNDDFDTIGGLILSLTRHVPERGEKIQHPCGLEFEIIDSDPRKINKVIIRK